jgi:ATP-binding protein involved in chromosome partitioning
MKIAIPTAEGLLCPHFGHCQQFAIVDVNEEKKEIISTTMLTPPAHEPGILPQWISQQECSIVIAGGMGGRALNMFGQSGITVISGASAIKPEDAVMAYLKGELVTGGNLCDEPSFKKGGNADCSQH